MADENKSSIWLRILEIIAGLIILVLAGYVIAYPRVAVATLIAFPINRTDCPCNCVFHTSICKRHFRMATTAQPDYVGATVIIAALVIDNPFIYGSLTLVYLLGLALLFAGIASAARGTIGGIVVGILGIIIGFVVIIFPGLGLATLVFLLAVFLVIFGLESIISGIMGRWV